jgi:hypothetical protein
VKAQWTIVVVLLLLRAANLPAQEKPVDEAAQHFSAGQELYGQGRYVEAIKEFTTAQQLSPHAFSLFNIARCYENLGEVREALHHYEQALSETGDPAGQVDIKQRISRLRSLPVKIFITSQPSGATITVDGHPQPEATVTPLMITLIPGEHVLLARKEAYALIARPIVVEVGREQTVEIKLQPLSSRCPAVVSCPKIDCAGETLFDAQGLHFHLAALGAFGKVSGRNLSPGAGLQAYTTFRRFFVGGHFVYFPTGQEEAGTIQWNGKPLAVSIKQRWIMIQAEGGWLFPFRTSYLYTSAGLGVSTDRLIYQGADLVGDLVQEQYSFAWSVGGGAEALAASWLSFGAGLRLGMGVGRRSAKGDPDQEEEGLVFPYLTFWGTMTFHL